MARWFLYAICLIVVLFVGGWAIVLVSADGDSRSEGSPSLFWHVGGLMVYASVICTPICFVAGLVALLVGHVVHGPERRRSRG